MFSWIQWGRQPDLRLFFVGQFFWLLVQSSNYIYNVFSFSILSQLSFVYLWICLFHLCYRVTLVLSYNALCFCKIGSNFPTSILVLWFCHFLVDLCKKHSLVTISKNCLLVSLVFLYCFLCYSYCDSHTSFFFLVLCLLICL